MAAGIIERINSKRKEMGRKVLKKHPWLSQAAAKASVTCFKKDKPKIDNFSAIFKSVKVVSFKTNDPKPPVDQVEGFLKPEGTDYGIAVNEGDDRSSGSQVVCITVLLGRR